MLENLSGYLFTAFLSLVVGYLLTYLQPKGKLFFWSPNFFRFHFPDRDSIQTDAITIQNLGRKAAEQIQIIFQDRPDHFQFHPAIDYTEEETQNHFIIKIDSLAPKEFVTIQILSFVRLPSLQNIRFSSGIAQPMPFQINRVYPKWFLGLLWILILAGIWFFINLSIEVSVFILNISSSLILN